MESRENGTEEIAHIYIYRKEREKVQRRILQFPIDFCSTCSRKRLFISFHIYILPRPYFSLSVDFSFPFYGGGSRLFHPHWPLGKGRDTGAAALYMICIGDGNENRKKGGARDKGIYVGVRRYKC